MIKFFIPDEMKQIKRLYLCHLRWTLTTFVGRGVCETVLQHFVHALKLQIAIEIALTQHLWIPQTVVGPHGVVRYIFIQEPSWKHL